MKKPVSATIEKELLDWITKTCKKSTIYRNKSHLIEAALLEFKRKMK